MASRDSFIVFISYSRKDDHLELMLEQAVANLPGVRVWSDTMIPIGENIHDNIEKAISQSDCVLLLLTQAAAASPEVREEIVRADIRRIPIIVVKEASVNDRQVPYFLRDRRYLLYEPGSLPARRLAEMVQGAISDLLPSR